METMTDEMFRFVVHRSKDGKFEYGVESGIDHHQVPYCAWCNGDKVQEIVRESSASHDNLLLQLMTHQDACRWLACQLPALDWPADTSKTLISAGIFRSVDLEYSDVDKDCVYLDSASPEFGEESRFLESADWFEYGGKSVINRQTGKEKKFLRKFIREDLAPQ